MATELTALTVRDFTALLASQTPAPGGGSASALLGAQGAALCAMVCALSKGEQLKLAQPVLEEKSSRFLSLVEEDTAAFSLVSAAYRLPRQTEAEKAARSAAIQTGLLECLRTPLEMMELAADVLALAVDAIADFNTSAASDLGVAALCLRAAAQGAWLNVRINLGSLKDAVQAERCRARGEAALARCERLADALYDAASRAVG